jgi:dihydropteroate synthase
MRELRCADKTLSFECPQIMGVLNITPDSFSDGGLLFPRQKGSTKGATQADLDRVRRVAEDMIAAGATVLDIGGESTRPGAAPVSIEEELDRVIPVLSALRELDTIVSLDTRHAQVAAAAIEVGVDLINDVSAGADPQMLQVVADAQVGFALMHMQGLPETMQQAPTYVAVVGEIATYLSERYSACLEAGIDPQRLIFDPGFGFGKTIEHNLMLLANLSALRVAERPLLVGLSRKSMLGQIAGRKVHDRVHASVAAALLAAERGADLLRVHDVAATQDALKLLTAMRAVQ